MQYHAIINRMVENELQDATEKELQFLSNFLLALTNRVEYFDENIVK